MSEPLLHIVHFLTDIPVFAIGALVVVGFLVYKREYKNVVIFVSVMGIALASVVILKTYFAVPRPDEALVALSTFSFPSGHSALVVALSIVMLYLFSHRIEHKGLRYTHDGVWIAMVPFIGYSRLALGVHRPEEVIAGFIVGAVVTLITIAFLTRIFTKKLKQVSVRKH